MNALITLPRDRERDAPTPDPEVGYELTIRAGWGEAFASSYAAWCLGLPAFDAENGAIHWTMRELRALRSCAIEYAMGISFTGDTDAGDNPEPRDGQWR